MQNFYATLKKQSFPRGHGYSTSKTSGALRLPSNSSLLPLVWSSNNLSIRTRRVDGSGLQTIHAASRTSTNNLIHEERVVPFHLSANDWSRSDSPIGYLRPEVAHQIQSEHIQSGQESLWNVLGDIDAMSFSEKVDNGGRMARTEAMKTLFSKWKDQGLFRDILRGAYHYASKWQT